MLAGLALAGGKSRVQAPHPNRLLSPVSDADPLNHFEPFVEMRSWPIRGDATSGRRRVEGHLAAATDQCKEIFINSTQRNSKGNGGTSRYILSRYCYQ
jgi:hypothetical protein